MGVSGCGKSTLGRRLAERLDAPFIEGDDFHPRANVEKMRAGIPLSDIDRWAWLDALARAFVTAMASRPIAVGSCSSLRRMYRDRLRASISAPVLFVLLELDRPALEQRMANRPEHYMPLSLLESQLATLERPKSDEAAIALDGTRPVDELVDAVVARIMAPAMS
jgi:gluconokinase